MTTTSTQAIRESKEYALQELRKLLPAGSTVFTTTTHTSRSGMLRVIRPIVLSCADNFPGKRDLSYLLALAGIAKEHPKHYGVKVGGCGMDMGFSLVYGLSRTLYPNGFDCLGQGNGCPSDDHCNDRWTPDMHDRKQEIMKERYALTRHHSDGGYAIHQSWL
jgi:hypothetical protein